MTEYAGDTGNTSASDHLPSTQSWSGEQSFSVRCCLFDAYYAVGIDDKMACRLTDRMKDDLGNCHVLVITTWQANNAANATECWAAFEWMTREWKFIVRLSWVLQWPFAPIVGSGTNSISLLVLSFFVYCCCCWSDAVQNKPRAPSFQIGSGWNLAELFFK